MEKSVHAVNNFGALMELQIEMGAWRTELENEWNNVNE